MYNSTAFARHINLTEPKGIMIHSSVLHHPYLRHYVRPDSKNKNSTEITDKLGFNKRFFDYNHTHRSHNFNYWIGKAKDDSIITVKALPTNIHSWESDELIHICICEDNLDNEQYLLNCLTQAINLCKELCLEYDWDSKQVHYPKEDFQYWFNKYSFDEKWFKEKLDKEKNL